MVAKFEDKIEIHIFTWRVVPGVAVVLGYKLPMKQVNRSIFS